MATSQPRLTDDHLRQHDGATGKTAGPVNGKWSEETVTQQCYDAMTAAVDRPKRRKGMKGKDILEGPYIDLHKMDRQEVLEELRLWARLDRERNRPWFAWGCWRPVKDDPREEGCSTRYPLMNVGARYSMRALEKRMVERLNEQHTRSGEERRGASSVLNETTIDGLPESLLAAWTEAKALLEPCGEAAQLAT